MYVMLQGVLLGGRGVRAVGQGVRVGGRGGGLRGVQVRFREVQGSVYGVPQDREPGVVLGVVL